MFLESHDILQLDEDLSSIEVRKDGNRLNVELLRHPGTERRQELRVDPELHAARMG